MKWISVKDQLPADISFIIAFGIREYEQFDEDECQVSWNCFYSLGDFYGFAMSDDRAIIDKLIVTHWMPLPEPPKEDSNSNLPSSDKLN